MLPFPNFEGCLAQRKTLLKGQKLYESQKIIHIEKRSKGIWDVYFPSERPNQEYKVTSHIQDGWLTYIHCPCDSPYGPFCEHSIASLLELKAHSKKEEIEGNEKLSKVKLKKFVSQLFTVSS